MPGERGLVEKFISPAIIDSESSPIVRTGIICDWSRGLGHTRRRDREHRGGGETQLCDECRTRLENFYRISVLIASSIVATSLFLTVSTLVISAVTDAVAYEAKMYD